MEVLSAFFKLTSPIASSDHTEILHRTPFRLCLISLINNKVLADLPRQPSLTLSPDFLLYDASVPISARLVTGRTLKPWLAIGKPTLRSRIYLFKLLEIAFSKRPGGAGNMGHSKVYLKFPLKPKQSGHFSVN